MKNHTHLSPRQEAQAERQLAEALLSLQTPEEVRSFLNDLCTPNELQAMADRWAVVECLQQGLPYREIYRRTGVSLTTIGRVARYLAQGSGGYALAVARTGSQKSCRRNRIARSSADPSQGRRSWHHVGSQPTVAPASKGLSLSRSR